MGRRLFFKFPCHGNERGSWELVFYEFPCLESEEFSWGLFVSWIPHYCFQCGSHGKSLSLQFPMPITAWENPTPVYPHDFSFKIRHGKVSLLPIPMKIRLEPIMGKDTLCSFPWKPYSNRSWENPISAIPHKKSNTSDPEMLPPYPI